MYRSGDVARWLNGGLLDHLGRADDQVKIRGFRIEPAEAEAVLARYPGIAAAIVVAREDIPGGKRLVGYLLPAADSRLDVSDVRAHAAASLPPYLVPSALVLLDALPLTANGKVDRAALPAPEPAVASPAGRSPADRSPAGRSAAGGEGSRGPRDEREAALCELFAGVLGRDLVGIDDSFFELGGTSLLGARLASRIRARLGVRLPLPALFETPTVAGLGARLAEAGEVAWADPLAVLLPLRAEGTAPPLFCVHPAAGIGWCYAALLPHLPSGVPLYALQARGLADPAARSASIAEMAVDYLREIRAVQPAAPTGCSAGRSAAAWPRKSPPCSSGTARTSACSPSSTATPRPVRPPLRPTPPTRPCWPGCLIPWG